MLKLRAILSRFSWLLWVILFGFGIGLTIYGVSSNSQAIYTKNEQPTAIIVLGDEDTVLDNMKIILSKEMSIVAEDGWMWAIIDFNSSCQSMNLHFSFPHQISSVIFTNYTDFDFFYNTWSYNSTTDNSAVFISYDSSSLENHIGIQFDWKISEKISYDQERIAVCFGTPFHGTPLFDVPREVVTTAGSAWIPQINSLLIQIEGKDTLDLSLTLPSPAYYYYLNDRTLVMWEFNNQSKTSSVQAVFENPILSDQKSNLIFNAGLFVGIGLSAIFLVIGKAIETITEKPN